MFLVKAGCSVMTIVKLVVFLIIVMELQGFQEEQKKVLSTIIYNTITNMDSQTKPIIFYEKLTYFDIKDILEAPVMKHFNQDTECIVISDIDHLDTKRKKVKIQLNKIIYSSEDGMTTMSNTQCQPTNTIEHLSGGIVKFSENKENCSQIAIFNIYKKDFEGILHDIYRREFIDAIGKLPVVVVVDPEYDGFSVEQVYKNNDIEPIVYNKPTINNNKLIINNNKLIINNNKPIINNNKPIIKDVSWFKKYWQVLLGSFSVAAVIGILCCLKFTR